MATAAEELLAAGKISQLYDELDFEDRYIALLGEVPEMYDFYQYIDISLPLIAPMAADARAHTGQAVFDLLSHPRIFDIAEQLIGPEVFSNPVQHTRIKPPKDRLPSGVLDANVMRTVWHQDAGVVESDAVNSNILTVWVAVTNATVENGCMYAVAGSHRSDLTMHCPGKDMAAELYIADSLIHADSLVSLEVEAGGIVLLHRLTEHGAGDNLSSGLRWSFDLRYQPVGQPTGRPYFPGFVARSQAPPRVGAHRPSGVVPNVG